MGTLRVVETHISRLLFVDDRVVKWYRPIATEFLDHRTVAARHRAIGRELELNRRFAPDVYLDVVAVAGSDGAELEPALLMRRLPSARRLSSMLDGPAAATAVAAVARVVATVHASARRSDAVDVAGAPDVVLGAWLGNLDELAHLASAGLAPDLEPGHIDAARLAFAGWVGPRRGFLERRVADGWIVDGHGDLLCDDIYVLDDGPRILDCLAFRDDFRFGDVAADLAFLVMDLDQRGHPELAEVLAATYEEHRGHVVPRGLLAAWTAHRAFVRAKVAMIRHTQGDESARADAVALFAAGRRHQARAEPIVVMIGGAPGTGKTSTARSLADELGASVLRSDEIRKELAGLDPLTSASAAPGLDLYSPEWTERTYHELGRRAAVVVDAGERVVLDASWSSDAARAAIRAEVGGRARVVELRCEVSPAVAAERVRIRAARGDDASDADVDVATWVRERFEPWPQACVLSTNRSLGDVVRDAVEACVGEIQRSSIVGE